MLDADLHPITPLSLNPLAWLLFIWMLNASRTEHPGTSQNWLAGAGGFEPPNGGIKIQMIWQRFQCAFRKTHEIQAYIDQ
jgi:hypothetical protein